MYLKSIEIHGFKSFANKILFEFHDGITAIVGPNGSGKSNVADAVRWVLGEQSAKQLRGSNMQDVIFSGSEARKPLGYAYVEITFDNCDHKLPIAYDEVSVSRRVYRSGESEYLINGMTCRLKDVQELFMDTGIGKEGYSIIGQGQIDKILSTKPEDRRELFDEAAGIVKFKKRKAIAEKNLEEAKENLSRIVDIILEIEKRIGPLERQSVTAKEYLRLKEILKNLEVNWFLNEYKKSDSDKRALEEKYNVAFEDLSRTKSENENAEVEYKRLEASIEDYNKALEEGRSYRSELLLAIEKNEGEIKVFEQQLLSISQNSDRVSERITLLNDEIEARKKELEAFDAQKKGYDSKIEELAQATDEAVKNVASIKKQIEDFTVQIDEANAGILKLTGDSGQIKSEIQRLETMLEQISIRKTEISQKLIFNKSEQSEAEEIATDQEQKYNNVTANIELLNKKCSELAEALRNADAEGRKWADIYEGTQQKYISEKSKLESLRNIAERYEGYGNAVKKIMEVRDRYPGINGVVADLISTDKKYETAVETALGASFQHIVTDDERTAKDIIEYLKNNKLGRATFLPITSVGRQRQENSAEVMKEKGVIGDAASLVTADSKYNGIVNHLLKSFIVVDNIDNALVIAKKYDYSLRMVTLEGEQFAPGGSIAGGAFKNSSNFLGRKREISEIEENMKKLSEEIAGIKDTQAKISAEKKSIRDSIDDTRIDLQKLYVEQNSAKLTLEKEKARVNEIANKAKAYEEESRSIEQKSAGYKNEISSLNAKLSGNDESTKALNTAIDDCNGKLITLRFGEGDAAERLNKLKIEISNVEQASGYTRENIERVNGEITKINNEKAQIEETRRTSGIESKEVSDRINANRERIEQDRTKLINLDNNIVELTDKKDSITREHKSFFDSWAELGKRVTELEKEVIRLGNQKEKLNDQLDAQINYIWDEYELTVATAEDYKDDNFKVSTCRKDINETKSQIKALGDVNVNSIEEFKTESERYTLLSAQRDDLLSSKESIEAIIAELDEEMRKQFTEQFKLIGQQFNTVFRELFGGGKGELELVEEEDMLEAGVRIIAQPPGKKLQNMMQLSGGEKALTAIALLFAIQNLKPSPFCLLDEIEAALDDSNVKRFASYLHKLTKNSQFIVITHRRGTMSAADIMYGITMQEKGVSTLVSVSLIEDNLDK